MVPWLSCAGLAFCSSLSCAATQQPHATSWCLPRICPMQIFVLRDASSVCFLALVEVTRSSCLLASADDQVVLQAWPETDCFF